MVNNVPFQNSGFQSFKNKSYLMEVKSLECALISIISAKLYFDTLANFCEDLNINSSELVNEHD